MLEIIDKKNMKITYSYKNELELLEYLDDISEMLYGVRHRMIHFINGNKLDFSTENCQIIEF